MFLNKWGWKGNWLFPEWTNNVETVMMFLKLFSFTTWMLFLILRRDEEKLLSLNTINWLHSKGGKVSGNWTEISIKKKVDPKNQEVREIIRFSWISG